MQKSVLPVEKAVAEAGKAQVVRESVLLADNGVRVEGGGLVYTGDVKRVTKREKRKIKKRRRGRKAEEEGSPRESDNKVGITWTEMVMIMMMMTIYTEQRAPPDSWGRCLCISLYLW